MHAFASKPELTFQPALGCRPHPQFVPPITFRYCAFIQQTGLQILTPVNLTRNCRIATRNRIHFNKSRRNCLIEWSRQTKGLKEICLEIKTWQGYTQIFLFGGVPRFWTRVSIGDITQQCESRKQENRRSPMRVYLSHYAVWILDCTHNGRICRFKKNYCPNTRIRCRQEQVQSLVTTPDQILTQDK